MVPLLAKLHRRERHSRVRLHFAGRRFAHLRGWPQLARPAMAAMSSALTLHVRLHATSSRAACGRRGHARAAAGPERPSARPSAAGLEAADLEAYAQFGAMIGERPEVLRQQLELNGFGEVSEGQLLRSLPPEVDREAALRSEFEELVGEASRRSGLTRLQEKSTVASRDDVGTSSPTPAPVDFRQRSHSVLRQNKGRAPKGTGQKYTDETEEGLRASSLVYKRQAFGMDEEKTDSLTGRQIKFSGKAVKPDQPLKAPEPGVDVSGLQRDERRARQIRNKKSRQGRGRSEGRGALRAQVTGSNAGGLVITLASGEVGFLLLRGYTAARLAQVQGEAKRRLGSRLTDDTALKETLRSINKEMEGGVVSVYATEEAGIYKEARPNPTK